MKNLLFGAFPLSLGSYLARFVAGQISFLL